MSTVTYEDFKEACSTYQGWCTQCKDFTRDRTEPDAEGYDCPVCGGNTVMGAENAMVCMEIEITDSPISMALPSQPTSWDCNHADRQN